MRTTRMLVAAAAVGLMLAACANQKEPAEKAFSKIETSIAEFRAEAEKYAGDELKEVDGSVAALKAKLAKQDFGAVLMAAPSVTAEVNALKNTVARKKADAEEILAAAQTEWTAIASAVPQLVTDVQARVDSFARTRKLPKDFSQQDFNLAKDTLEDIRKVWGEATAEAAEGKVADAVRKGRAVKTNAEYLLQRLAA